MSDEKPVVSQPVSPDGVPASIAPQRVHISEYIARVSEDISKAFMHMEGQLYAKDQEIKSMIHASGGKLRIEPEHLTAALSSILHLEKHEGGAVTVTVKPAPKETPVQ